MYQQVNYVSAATAISIIQSNQRVFIHGGACTPHFLLQEMGRQKDRLQNVELVCVSVQGNFLLANDAFASSFHVNSLFVSEPIREAVQAGRADFVPIFLSDIPDLFKKTMVLDVAIVQVSPPDEHGYCTLGVSVDIARAAVSCARQVIALVNPQMPRTHGDGLVHTDRFSHMVYHEAPLIQIDYAARTGEAELKIGGYVAELIDDGSTLQMGIGTIPDAVFKCLHNHKNLGVHTEMCSNGIVELIEKDVINNTLKKIHPYKTVTGFAVGTSMLYQYVHNNPAFAFLDIDYVNDPHVIRRNPKVVAVNSAIEVDVTGQVCADSIGIKQYSGIGGQMDFMRGAALSEGGKPIIALTSRTHSGLPRIVPTLREGAGVVTTRGHVHYIITEYGTAFLYGQNLRQRARALIDIAHPQDREALERQCAQRFTVFPCRFSS